MEKETLWERFTDSVDLTTVAFVGFAIAVFLVFAPAIYFAWKAGFMPVGDNSSPRYRAIKAEILKESGNDIYYIKSFRYKQNGNIEILTKNGERMILPKDRTILTLPKSKAE